MPFCRRQVDSIAGAGVRVTRFFLSSRTHPAQLWKEYGRLRTVIEEQNPDLVHAHFGTVTAALCRLAVSRPLVITYRGTDLNPLYFSFTRNLSERFVRHAIGRMLSQIAAYGADGVICVSEQLRRRVWWPGARRRAVVIPVGVSTSTFAPIDWQEARRRLNISLTTPLVLFNSGRQPTVKRTDLAHAALANAQQHDAGITMFELDGLQDAGTVNLYLSAADCLLMTSDYEGSPNIVKEAIACNLPVVSVDVGDVRERLAHVQPSFVGPGTPEWLGRAIFDAVSLRTRSNGRDVVMREIAEPLVAQRIVEYYDWVRMQTRAMRT